MNAEAERKCSVCGERIAAPATSGLVKQHLVRKNIREAHCDNERCTWCRACVTARELASRQRDRAEGK